MITGPLIQKMYGRHLPSFVCVLSTIIPIRGSLTASQTFVAERTILVMASDSPKTSVKYIFKAVPISV